jgi:hypothetical protein
MGLTAAEREFLDKLYDTLTENERNIMMLALDDMVYRAKVYGVPLRDGEVLEKLKAAFVRYLLDCKGIDTSVAENGFPALDIDAKLWKGQPMHIRAKNERKVVYALLTQAVEAGFQLVDVYDGDEHEKVSNVKEAMEVVFNLDISYVWMCKEGFKKHYLMFVLGNAEDGSEALADWSYTDGDPDGWNALVDGFDASKVV